MHAPPHLTFGRRRPPRLPRTARLVVAALLLLGAAVALPWAIGVLHTRLDEYLAWRAARFLAEHSRPGLKLSIGKVRTSFGRREVRFHDATLRYQRSRGEVTRSIEADVPVVKVTGIELLPLLFRHRLKARRVTLEQPRLVRHDEAPHETRPRPNYPALDSTIRRVAARFVPHEFRSAAIGAIEVDSATMVTRVDRAGHSGLDSLAGVSIEFSGLDFDTTASSPFHTAQLSVRAYLRINRRTGDTLSLTEWRGRITPNDTSYGVAEARLAGPGKDDSYALRLVNLQRSVAGRSVSVDTLVLLPRAGDRRFFQAAGARRTRIRLTLAGVSVRGLDHDALRHHKAVARHITVAMLHADALADYRLPPAPPRSRGRWPQKLATMDWIITVDSTRIGGGEIRYAELHPERPEPAEISFEKLGAVLLNLSNDPEHSGLTRPAVLKAEARLLGQGRLRATFEVPVVKDEFRAHVEGDLSSMPLAGLTRFLIVSDGMRLKEGSLSSATFAFDVSGGKARGQFAGAYDGLDFEVVDKTTHERSLGDKLKTALADLVTRDSNKPTKDGAVPAAKIDYDVQPQDSFWGIMWRAVRSGIRNTMRH